MALEGLDALDYVLLVTSMALCALIGLYFSNKNKDMQAYMLGDRSLGVIPVAVSLMTSCMSALSLLGSSAELYYQGPTYAFIVLAILLCGPITAYTILPVFYKMNELSLYKYLEARFGLTVKYIISLIFVIQMLFYNAVVLYVPAMSLQAVIGIDRLYSILLIGIMCVLYSGIGGLKAVVWTDFYQAMLMYASIIVVGLLGTYDAGGIKNVISTAANGHRLDLDGFWNMDLITRHTFWGIILGSTIKHVYLVGVNQVQMQRALSLPSLKQAQHCFLACAFFTALISALSSYMGLVLYSAYLGCDPYLDKQIPRRDAVIVHYVARRLSKIPGLRGIFVAGIFSATLSTLSSFANSMAALAIEDYIKPIRRKLNRSICQINQEAGQEQEQEQEQQQDDEERSVEDTKLAKILATLFGIICVLTAYLIDKANSRLLQATTTMFGAVGVPFLAAFAMGIFTRFTNSIGMVTGLIVTVTLGVYITIMQTFFQPSIDPKMPIHFDETCALAFNETLPFSAITPIVYESESQTFPPVEPPFSIDRISYMSLPAFQFLLTILISSIVSLLSGGWSQEVPEQYLMSFLHTKNGGKESHQTETAGYHGGNSTSNYHQHHKIPPLNGSEKSSSFDKATVGYSGQTRNSDDDLDRKRKIGVVDRNQI